MVAENVQQHVRHVGDTLTDIAVTLQRPDGTPVDLTSLTVKFKMLDSQGNVKVAETSDNVTVTDEASGQCHYNPQAADVDTEGTFFAYFTTTDGSSKKDTFPAQKGDFKVVITGDV